MSAFLAGIPYAHASGMRAIGASVGKASLMLPASPKWTGDAQRQLIHPGCSSVLADTACGMAVGAAMAQLEPIATLDLRMDYLRPAPAQADLICHAHCYRLTRNIAFVRGEVLQGQSPDPVAVVNAAFMRGTAPGRREAAPRDSERRPAATASPSAAAPETPQAPALPLGLSPYVDYLDVRKSTLADGTPLFRLPFHPDLIGNPILPALHGGVLAGFAETAMVLHLALTAEPVAESPARGVDFSIDYLRSARPVDTFVSCTTIRKGSRVALVQAALWQDDAQRPIATARGHLLLP